MSFSVENCFKLFRLCIENNPGLKPSMSLTANNNSLKSCVLNEIPAENNKTSYTY